MGKQMTLPGISRRVRTADVRALVLYRLAGFALRQAAREQRRAARRRAAR